MNATFLIRDIKRFYSTVIVNINIEMDYCIQVRHTYYSLSFAFSTAPLLGCDMGLGAGTGLLLVPLVLLSTAAAGDPGVEARKFGGGDGDGLLLRCLLCAFSL